mmetsp:Transcript_25888/g.50732  ORF Transcript_25888/g.50732 Transcript_25888/m.50732 type:complete len:211 (+) Transcript_25888:444-1076(+)
MVHVAEKNQVGRKIRRNTSFRFRALNEVNRCQRFAVPSRLFILLPEDLQKPLAQFSSNHTTGGPHFLCKEESPQACTRTHVDCCHSRIQFSCFHKCVCKVLPAFRYVSRFWIFKFAGPLSVFFHEEIRIILFEVRIQTIWVVRFAEFWRKGSHCVRSRTRSADRYRYDFTEACTRVDTQKGDGCELIPNSIDGELKEPTEEPGDGVLLSF